MEQVPSNSCDLNPSNGYNSYSISYVYNMDTGLVETHPATVTMLTETSMQATGEFSSGSADSSREQAGGLVLPAGDGCSEVTTGIGGGEEGRGGPESGQFDNFQEFRHHGSDNSQSEISQNNRSLANSNAVQTTYPICLSISIADSDHDVGEESSRQDLNTYDFLEKVVETALGEISYSHMPKRQECQSLSVEYEMIEEENGSVNEYQSTEQHSYHEIVVPPDVLRYENAENESNMISAIDRRKSVSASMAPVPKFINRPTSEAPTSNYALSSTNLVVVDIPRRAEQCPENGEIIYVQVGDESDFTSAKLGEEPITTNEKIINQSDMNGVAISHVPSRSDSGTSLIDNGAGTAAVVTVTEPLGKNQTLENNDKSQENNRANDVGEAPDSKGKFREPPRISRQLGVFGTGEYDESQQKDNNKSPADDKSGGDLHNVGALHSPAETSSEPDGQREPITLPHCLVDGGSIAVMSSASSLARSSAANDYDNASRAVLSACNSFPAVAVPSSQPIKPVALSASMPPTHQLIACGMTGVLPAVTQPVHPQPMLPIPLPPLAVFTHPIHLFPATLPWHVHSHIAGPAPQRTSGRYPTNCPHFNPSPSITNTTTVLNSTARLAASYPLLKRGRRPRRPPLPTNGPSPKHETNSDGTSPPISKRTEANARERERVTHLNGGFEQLRRVLPWAYRGGRRVSKVDTLRAAISYIRFLQSILVGAELSPAETIRLRNGIVLENTVRIVQNVEKAPYPILPPGYRFVNPPSIPLPPPPLPPPPPPPPPPPLSSHPTLPLAAIPAQPPANLPPIMHLRTGYEGQTFHTVTIPPLLPSHPNGIRPGNESTALSWLINFQGNLGMPPIDSTERDVMILGTTSQASTNQDTKNNHVIAKSRKKSLSKGTVIT